MIKLFEFIKKAVRKILGKENIQKALKLDVATSDKMSKRIELWTKMYEDKATWKIGDTKSMNLACSIASEISRLVTLEMKSEVTGSERAEFINQVYQKLLRHIRIETEYACAKGGIVFKPFLSGDKIAVDCIHADKLFPVAFDSDGELVSAVFVEKLTKENDIYTKLEFHEFDNGNCTIINRAFVSSFGSLELGTEIPLSKVPEWADLEEEVHCRAATRPFFSYFKMPLANTIDSESNIGVSVYSRAVDLIREADEQYSRILWEYKGSELAIDVDETCLAGGKELPKGSERLFRGLDLQGRGEDFYKVFSPDIRDSSLFNGLNKQLQRIEFACGLAYGTLSDVQETAKTATEILASKQRSYSTVSDIQKALQNSLENLLISINDLCDMYKIGGSGEYEVGFEFDDSLIVDSGTDQTIMLQEVAAGIIKPEIYLMRRYGLTEDQCKDYMPASKNEIDTDVKDEE